MIIISKKRIQIIVSCLVIAILVFMFQMANTKNEFEENSTLEQSQQDTVLTTATPVSGKTIVVDAGHGVPDERCRKQ